MRQEPDDELNPGSWRSCLISTVSFCRASQSY